MTSAAVMTAQRMLNIIIVDICHLGSVEPAPPIGGGSVRIARLVGGPHAQHYMPDTKSGLQVFRCSARCRSVLPHNPSAPSNDASRHRPVHLIKCRSWRLWRH